MCPQTETRLRARGSDEELLCTKLQMAELMAGKCSLSQERVPLCTDCN